MRLDEGFLGRMMEGGRGRLEIGDVWVAGAMWIIV